jgi:hypothetical protein
MPDATRYSEALVALFGFGVVAFSPLMLSVFDPPGGETAMAATFLGVPLLFLYLFTAWGVLIVLLAFVVERARFARDGLGAADREPGE